MGRVALVSSALTATGLAYLVLLILYSPAQPATSTEEIVRSAGYPCESHEIETKDGYLLTVFRIPHGKGPVSNSTRPVFFLQHGLTGSSDQWVVLGPERALGFLLADRGYDVWIGNARGNRYSLNHIRYGSSYNSEYWDFSWDEMGDYDLPAVISHIQQITQQKKIFYAGHSMGTAMLMVLFNKHPEYQEKVEIAFALAPAVFVGHSRSIVFTWLTKYLGPFILKLKGHSQFLPSNFTQLQNWMWPKCSPEYTMSTLCRKLYEITGGPTTEVNPETMPAIMCTNPSQTSAKTFAHYGQSILSGEFRAYDYNEKGNILKYGTPKALEYHLKNISTPIAILFSDNDYIAPPKDEYDLCTNLGNVIEYYRVPLQTFNHLDFLYGWSAKDLLYKKIFEILDDRPRVLKQKAHCFQI